MMPILLFKSMSGVRSRLARERIIDNPRADRSGRTGRHRDKHSSRGWTAGPRGTNLGRDPSGTPYTMLATFLKWMHKPIYASRIEALVQLIIPQLAESDRVLDVGCGAGALGRRILDSPSCPLGVEITGLEVLPRADRLIPIETYDGRRISFPDQAFDVVILADVLHHAADAHLLLSECARVTRRTLLVKDHKVEGFLAEKRLTLIDWAANKPRDRMLVPVQHVGRMDVLARPPRAPSGRGEEFRTALSAGGGPTLRRAPAVLGGAEPTPRSRWPGSQCLKPRFRDRPGEESPAA